MPVTYTCEQCGKSSPWKQEFDMEYCEERRRTQIRCMNIPECYERSGMAAELRRAKIHMDNTGPPT